MTIAFRSVNANAGTEFWSVCTEAGEILADFHGQYAQENAEYFASRLNGGPK